MLLKQQQEQLSVLVVVLLENRPEIGDMISVEGEMGINYTILATAKNADSIIVG